MSLNESSERARLRSGMNRASRMLFVCFALLLVAFAALFANYQRVLGQPAVYNKTVWAALAGGVFFAFGAWRFSPEWRGKICAVLFSLMLAEIVFQAAAGIGVLPGLNTKLKAPYARVYWSAEGGGNSVRNRLGWHYPEFDLKASRRIAVIGDSFVEAVEVGRARNEAAVLERLLHAHSPDVSVLGLGTHGTSPAHHLDVLDYAQRHFPPTEAIIILYLGNDINESLPSLNYVPPEGFIYYDLDPAGNLALVPASKGTREGLIRSMEQCHYSVWVQLPVIVKSHCMILQTVISIKDTLKLRALVRKLAEADPEAAKWGRFGTSLKAFTTEPNPEQRRAMDILLAELALIQQKCQTNGTKLHLVTVPFFPARFYTTQSGPNWSLKLDKYDFLGPDREIAAFARERGISFLSFGAWLAERTIDVSNIQKLYLIGGTGHFNEAGHQLCAQAMFETFYRQPKR